MIKSVVAVACLAAGTVAFSGPDQSSCPSYIFAPAAVVYSGAGCDDAAAPMAAAAVPFGCVPQQVSMPLPSCENFRRQGGGYDKESNTLTFKVVQITQLNDAYSSALGDAVEEEGFAPAVAISQAELRKQGLFDETIVNEEVLKTVYTSVGLVV
jgi:hypothetical protein